jgi:hypothetical protein
LYYQDADVRWHAHAKMIPGRTFNIASIAQPGLFQLQAAPFRNDIIALVFQLTKVNRQLTALMSGVDDPERADDYSSEGKNNYH